MQLARSADWFFKLFSLIADRKARLRIFKYIRQRRSFQLLIFILGSSSALAAFVKLKAKNQKLAIDVVRRDSAFVLKDGEREVCVQYKGKTMPVRFWPTRKLVFDAHKRLFIDLITSDRDNIFFKIRQFVAVFSIMCPRLTSKEVTLLALQALFLLIRTQLSILGAKADNNLVNNLINADFRQFLRSFLIWLTLAIPSSYTNSMIYYIQGRTALAFRTRLIRYYHDLYLNEKLPYYRAIALEGGIENFDQHVTAEISTMCNKMASLISSLGKPTIDLIFFSRQLLQSMGILSVSILCFTYYSSSRLLRAFSPSFNKLAHHIANAEGRLRNKYNQIGTNTEEIAFYNGGTREYQLNTLLVKDLISAHGDNMRMRFAFGILEDYVIKYSWSACGYIVSALSIYLDTDSGENSQYIFNRRIMQAAGDAGGRIMYSYKNISELATYVDRVHSVLTKLHRAHSNSYFDDVRTEIIPYGLNDLQGTRQFNFDGIRLEGVPVIIPTLKYKPSYPLIPPLNFVISPGQHLIITGGNGIGKTAILRVIAGLWPVFRGLLSVPRASNILYLSQRAYLGSSTFREQIIYPHSHAQMIANGKSDQDLLDILEIVKLSHILQREGGLDAKKEWKDVLSGGEKQRVQLARLFYFQPKFAVLDESTGAISADVEAHIYQEAQNADITILTISHRPTLHKFHDYELQLIKGQYGIEWRLKYTKTNVHDANPEQSSAELQKLIEEKQKLISRRDEINKMLFETQN